MAVVVGFGFAPNSQDIVQLLQKKKDDDGFRHDHIQETQVYSRDPEELYNVGLATGNKTRWFFSRLENGNRQTPNGGIWTNQGRQDHGDAVEKSFTHSLDRSWHMKEYTLNGALEWALYCVYRK